MPIAPLPCEAAIGAGIGAVSHLSTAGRCARSGRGLVPPPAQGFPEQARHRLAARSSLQLASLAQRRSEERCQHRPMAHSQVPGLLRRVARRVLPRMCLYAEPAQRRLSQSSATTDVSAATATIQNLVGRGKLRHPPQCARSTPECSETKGSGLPIRVHARIRNIVPHCPAEPRRASSTPAASRNLLASRDTEMFPQERQRS